MLFTKDKASPQKLCQIENWGVFTLMLIILQDTFQLEKNYCVGKLYAAVTICSIILKKIHVIGGESMQGRLLLLILEGCKMPLSTYVGILRFSFDYKWLYID